jgi:hypothetical protein
MRDFLKNKVVTVLIVIATVILAGVAIFTAYRLYQSGTEPVAPTAPEPVPAAGGQPTPTPQACQELAFTITTPTPSVTVMPTVTPTVPVTTTPTEGPTPTPTEPPRGGSSPTPTQPISTVTPIPTGTTPTSVVTSTPTPTQADQLPDAGTSMPTIFVGALGILLILLSLALAL